MNIHTHLLAPRSSLDESGENQTNNCLRETEMRSILARNQSWTMGGAIGPVARHRIEFSLFLAIGFEQILYLHEL
ncbi:MAG: hypothetical protein DIZ78_01705 [endosymbiont of Escarpia spicata]|uniref:Uncharacterized protein n=1 Tax=endosymbiont of Escarpia spicata TaxID=2200908 RepID=A0A370DUA7_9GAMM|nr:MAG: hypothetical protein DIZ78_01705 [endosymbiont of Escarpia spicata]